MQYFKQPRKTKDTQQSATWSLWRLSSFCATMSALWWQLLEQEAHNFKAEQSLIGSHFLLQGVENGLEPISAFVIRVTLSADQ